MPEGITPAQNGKMPTDKLKKIHCGGYLYADAARAWLAMLRAAAKDNVFLNLNYYSRAYRPIERQMTLFKQRFVPVENANNLSSGAIRVPFEGKIWQLKPDAVYAAIPGTSSHGYGLAIDIENSGLDYVKNWLSKNVENFGFVREYNFEPWHYTYIKSREGIPSRVLEIENLPPEPTYSAEQIEKISGGKWFKKPLEDWICNGIFYARPLRAGYIAAVDQGCGMGIKEQTINVIFRQLAGLLCVNPTPLVKFNLPILEVADVKIAIEKLSYLCTHVKVE